MAEHRILIKRWYRVEAYVAVTVEAEDREEAISMIENEEVDIPDKAEWRESWECIDEVVGGPEP